MLLMQMVQKSRRNVLKTIGGTFAGATGLTVIASRAKAAKAHDVEVTAESNGGSGGYRIILPDPYANFSGNEGGDDQVRDGDTTIWSGSVDDGVIGTASDDAHFNNVSGALTASDITTTSGSILVRLDTDVIYTT